MWVWAFFVLDPPFYSPLATHRHPACTMSVLVLGSREIPVLEPKMHALDAHVRSDGPCSMHMLMHFRPLHITNCTPPPGYQKRLLLFMSLVLEGERWWWHPNLHPHTTPASPPHHSFPAPTPANDKGHRDRPPARRQSCSDSRRALHCACW